MNGRFRGATKILRYTLRNALRGRALLGYGLFFLAVSGGLLRFGGGLERALPSLASVTLLIVPLVSLVVGTVSLFDGRDFTELLLSHPVGRDALFLALYLGLALPLSAAYLVGAGLPLVWYGAFGTSSTAVLLLLLGGVLLTAIFTALACWVALSFTDAARALGAALLLWLLLTVLYDGVVLLAAHALADWPLERPLLAAMLLNPVDVARVLVLTGLDASVLMGYTGAVFERFFGSGLGTAVALTSLSLWVILPAWVGLRRFRRMDF
ncbi:MAG: ABC transporter permease subunit [Gemmatimonadota bacterium]